MPKSERNAQQNPAQIVDVTQLVGRSALVRSSAHSSRYGYIGFSMVYGTIVAADKALLTLRVEGGRFHGKEWEIETDEAKLYPAAPGFYSLQGEGAWAGGDARLVENPDIIIERALWQPE